MRDYNATKHKESCILCFEDARQIICPAVFGQPIRMNEKIVLNNFAEHLK